MTTLPTWTGWGAVPLVYKGLITEPRAAKKARPWSRRAVNYAAVLFILWIPGALTFLRWFIFATVEAVVIVYALLATGAWALFRLRHTPNPELEGDPQ